VVTCKLKLKNILAADDRSWIYGLSSKKCFTCNNVSQKHFRQCYIYI